MSLKNVFIAVCMLAFLKVGYSEETPDIKRLSAEFTGALAAQDFNKAAGFVDSGLRNEISAEAIGQAWNGLISQYGKFINRKDIQTAFASDSYEALAVCRFEKKSVAVKMSFTLTGRLQGFFFYPREEYTAPAYVNSALFTEQQVIVGSGKWALPGTLTLPKGKGPFAALALVHGSGPNDRDETMGPNKPFRDIAQGLASQGIAVLRYDKRTFAHNKEASEIKNFTVKEETVDDAVLAAELLRGRKEIVPSKVFVLGHSLGGELIPRIGAACGGQCAGFIVLAGSTQPDEDVLIRQLTYIFSLDGKISDEEREELEKTKADAARIKAPALSPGDPPIDGIPPAYYLDLRGYYSPDAAKKLGKPMLILQGERDYQVTISDFENWKKALSDKTEVEFKSYTRLNHLFCEGAGTPLSTPGEYRKAANVAGYVIDDLASWLKAR